jgi:hypothetical protein
MNNFVRLSCRHSNGNYLNDDGDDNINKGDKYKNNSNGDKYDDGRGGRGQ